MIDSATSKAILLIKSIRNELILGTKHYNKEGELLKTDLEIVEALVSEGGCTIEPTPERKHLFPGYEV
jgi:hypothetical protein